MLVTDRRLCGRKSLESIIKSACKSGVKLIQLREKDLPANQLLILALKLRAITKKYSCGLIINDRIDIALLSNADGVHSPADGVSSKYIKKYGLTAGKSVHSIDEALGAQRGGYDYLIFGPVFRTQFKVRYGKPLGLKKLKEVCEEVRIPVIAIGGITPERASKCIASGAAGVAVMSAILRSPNIESTVGQFIEFSKSPDGHRGRDSLNI